ncbi:N-acetylmuramoyl-L-alanine amidase [Actinomadura geliboluensis]|uniref:N-acetylmuramoyl-L-alanine amidase n=1 Tax=Actinomadura geliboluensis TaxID=882440 RepID=UPI0036C491B5
MHQGEQVIGGGGLVRWFGSGLVAGMALSVGLVLAGCGGGADNGTSGEGTPGTGTPTGGTPKTSAPGTRAASPVSGKVIVLDPGHNGGNASHPEVINKQVFIGNGRKPCNTVGTSTPDGYAEHAFTWDVANRLARRLRDEGAKVTLTRENDTGVGPCITERAAIANRARADAALSIHADGAAASGHGFHVIVPAPVGENKGIVDASRRLGLDIRDAFHAGTGLPFATYVGREGLDRRDDLGGLNLSTVPAAFIECGNMANAGDAAKMSSASFRQRMADSLAQGFDRYFQ